MSAYHAVELVLTTLAVGASAVFVLRGWLSRLLASRRGSALTRPGGCSSCNDCGACEPVSRGNGSPLRFIRDAAR
jgi:hypothetical protein